MKSAYECICNENRLMNTVVKITNDHLPLTHIDDWLKSLAREIFNKCLVFTIDKRKHRFPPSYSEMELTRQSLNADSQFCASTQTSACHHIHQTVYISHLFECSLALIEFLQRFSFQPNHTAEHCVFCCRCHLASYQWEISRSKCLYLSFFVCVF